MAQMLGLDKDAGESVPPHELQLRRRLWWQICAQESRGAEEVGYKVRTIMQNHNVPLPANLSDLDIHPTNDKHPLPRVGVTDSTYVILRLEILDLGNEVWKLRQESADERSLLAVQERQRAIVRKAETRLQAQILQYMDSSRPFDFLCAMAFYGMIVSTAGSILIRYCH